MQYVIKRKFLIMLAIPLIMGLFLAINSVNAQEERSGGSGLRISPTRTELSLDDGESREITQTVKNVTQSPITVQPTLNDFEADGLTGQPQLIGDPNEISAHSLRDFITLPDDFDLQPDEELEVTVALLVPGGASPGAYYGSVLYRASPLGSTDEGQVSLVASVGSLVLLEVPGDITEQIEIEKVSAYLDEESGALFVQKPNNVGVLINNLGNSYSKPFGKIAVNDWRGNVIYEYELNSVERPSNILPESSRLYLQELFDVEEKTVNGVLEQSKTSPIKWPGKYTISGVISHGTIGQPFTISASFWYIPLWLVIVTLLVFVILVGSAYYLYRKHLKNRLKKRR